MFFQGHYSLRTLDKLYPLEITPVSSTEEKEDTPDIVESNDTTPDVVEGSDTMSEVDILRTRPRRAAAIFAAKQRKALIAFNQL